jgi:hypothetical protein
MPGSIAQTVERALRLGQIVADEVESALFKTVLGALKKR